MEREEHKIIHIKKIKHNDMKALKCPCCGANLPLDDNKSTTCLYCGVNIVFSKKISSQLDKRNETTKQCIAAPNIEELNNENHENHVITKIEKGDKTGKLSDKAKTSLIGLGIMAISGIGLYLSFTVYPPKYSNSDTQFFLRILLLCASLAGIGLGGIGSIADFDSDSDFNDKDNHIDGGKK